jgi:hypothetical protein
MNGAESVKKKTLEQAAQVLEGNAASTAALLRRLMETPPDYMTLSMTVTQRTFQEVLFLKEALHLSNEADAVAAAVRLASFLVGEVQRGTAIFLESPSGAISHLNTDGWPTSTEEDRNE